MASIQALKLQATQIKNDIVFNASYFNALVVFHNMKTKAKETRDNAIVLVRQPQFQKHTIATAGGAITLGIVGGTFGLASGVVVGSAAGVVPALFTFGLSIPAGAVIGGIGGSCTGTLIGSSTGGVGGFTTYKYRVQIVDGVMVVKVKAQDTLRSTKEKVAVALTTLALTTWASQRQAQAKLVDHVNNVLASVNSAACRTKTSSLVAVNFTKYKASKAITYATTTKVGVTSSSAVAGAVVGGTTSGAFGAVAGAAAGIVPAFFTFGLSIPVGAVVGLCVGSTVGGTAGAVGGGALGYGGFTHREAISENVYSSCSKVSNKANDLKTSAFTCAAEANKSVRSLVKAGTGGSA